MFANAFSSDSADARLLRFFAVLDDGLPTVTVARSTGPQAGRFLLWAIALLALARLLSLPWYPLMDNTESRYAEIARRMLAQSDWVTPWIGDGVPFWGKPPLSFWATQTGMALFGATEWGARLPHFLLGVAVAALAGWQASAISQRAAWHTVALLAGSLLFMVSSGAVMTDMALTLGNTLLMVGLWRAWQGGGTDRVAAVLMVLGATVGLLAKGPVALVLWGLPVLAWALTGGRTKEAWRRVPWLRGALLVLALSLPWYLLAENRTPGFLQYFIVGEHFQRFITPGWKGDLYGTAHIFPRGSIWLFAVAAVLPWSLLLPLVAWAGWAGRLKPAADTTPPPAGQTVYLLAWALAPCVFFTVAGNILWTYVLPGLPALAIWVGCWTAGRRNSRLVEGSLVAGLAIATLGIAGSIAAGRASGTFDDKSLGAVLHDQHRLAAPGEAIYVLGSMPFSGSFYSSGQARAVASLDALPADRVAWVVLSPRELASLPAVQRARLSVMSTHGQHLLARWV